MKSVIKENKTEQVNEYPKLMRYKKTNEIFIVLFIGDKTGIVVCDSNNEWGIGYYFKEWVEESFTPFNGTIELSNN